MNCLIFFSPILISNISNSTFLLKCSKLKSVTNFFFIPIFVLFSSPNFYQIFYILLAICLLICIQRHGIRITWSDFIIYTSFLTSVLSPVLYTLPILYKQSHHSKIFIVLYCLKVFSDFQMHRE